MAQSIEINGQVYPDVPSINVPLSTSGTASFYDVSDSTVGTNDVISGKVFYTSNGTRSTGSLTVPVGIPSGGTTGQVLTKESSTDYDADWENLPDTVHVGTSAPTDSSTMIWLDTDEPGQTSITLDQVYPVGSIYLSTNNVSPASLFGGTWIQIQDRFLLAAGTSYTAGNTGGEATHTLTESEVPSHTHERGTMNITGGFAPWSEGTGTNITNPTGAFTAVASNQYGWGTSSGRDQDNAWIDFDASKSWTGETTSFGGDGAHNNMPPYLVVYMWARTA